MLHDLFHAGGAVMPPLLLLSFAIWVALAWSAAVILWQRCADTGALEAWAAGPRDPAAPLPGRGWQTALCAVAAAPGADARGLDLASQRLLRPLEGPATVVQAMVHAAPLLGLLGTVLGMIQAFQALQLGGPADPNLLADGIRQALVSTQVGLLVAVPAFFAERRLDRLRQRLQLRLEETRLILRRHLPAASAAIPAAPTAPAQAALAAPGGTAPCA